MERKKKPPEVGDELSPGWMWAGTCAELLGWSMAELFAQIRSGTVPPPEVHGVWAVFPIQYVVHLKRDGLSLPGTFRGFPPGYSPSRELTRWINVGNKEKPRYVRRAELQRLGKRALKGGAK